MPTIQHERVQTGYTNAYVAKWEGLGNGDDTDAISSASYSDKSAQVFGTFGAGGSLTVQGSNDGVNWATLSDPQGNPLVFTSAKIELVSEATQFVRGLVAGDGTTDLTLLILFKE